MRLMIALDRFLSWRKLERDATARSNDSYYRDLRRIIDDHGAEIHVHDFEGRIGTDMLRRTLAKHWGSASAATRAKVISEIHSLFDWLHSEDLIETNPAIRIKRPPKRKPNVYRPTPSELMLCRNVLTLTELAPWRLMDGGGLRVSDLIGLTWDRIDLTDGRVQLHRKGNHWQWIPLAPDVIADLQRAYRLLAPDPDHHVFTAETEQWIDNEHRIRKTLDPTTPRTPKAVWTMVKRVCDRAGTRPLHPHLLRHGFATGFVRQSRETLGAADIETLQFLLGHSRIDTTQRYVDEMEAEDAAAVLRRMYAQASPVQTTSEGAMGDPLGFSKAEAAGFEPASAVGREDDAGGTESEVPSDEDVEPPSTGYKRDGSDAV